MFDCSVVTTRVKPGLLDFCDGSQASPTPAMVLHSRELVVRGKGQKKADTAWSAADIGNLELVRTLVVDSFYSHTLRSFCLAHLCEEIDLEGGGRGGGGVT